MDGMTGRRRQQVLRYARPQRPSDGKILTIDDVRKWKRMSEAELVNAAVFIRATIKQKPAELAYLEEAVAFMEESEITLRQAEAVVMLTEVLLRGALDGRLDFLEMLRMIHGHQSPAEREKARRILDAMSKGEVPFLKTQVQ